MERVSVDDIEPRPGPAAEKRPLASSLGASRVALNRYELEPGESFAFGYHAHEDQEEVFYVLSGRATFETADGVTAVGPDEAIRFGPGEYQRGWNRDDERVVALAIGAPREAGALDLLWDCPDCETRTANRIEATDDALLTVCKECGAETQRFER